MPIWHIFVKMWHLEIILIGLPFVQSSFSEVQVRIKLHDANVIVHIHCHGLRNGNRVVAAHHDGNCTFRNDFSDSLGDVFKALVEIHRIHINISGVNYALTGASKYCSILSGSQNPAGPRP